MGTKDINWHNEKIKRCGICRMPCGWHGMVSGEFFIIDGVEGTGEMRCPLLTEAVYKTEGEKQ